MFHANKTEYQMYKSLPYFAYKKWDSITVIKLSAKSAYCTIVGKKKIFEDICRNYTIVT